MTPVFCCGAECGIEEIHFTRSGSATSIDTTTKRTGNRSFRANPAATAAGQIWISPNLGSSAIWVIRIYVNFATLPTFDSFISRASTIGAYFKSSDNKIYAAYDDGSTITFGATGVSVATGQWYRIDILINLSANPWTCDVQVNGSSASQITRATSASTASTFIFGAANPPGNNLTADIYFDDIIVSKTSADYPIGPGKVEHFIPTADGTHNVAGANDFERSATGTDITNATTTAYQLIDDVPLKSGNVTEYINLIAPPNATDYVEVVFGPASGISTPTAAPRAVEAIVAYAKGTGTGTNNLRIALNDNGSTDDIFNGNVSQASPSAAYARKHYADPPSAASAWTLSGNGNFNNVRMRCYTSDAAPDPWWASAMIEAEFEEVITATRRIFIT